jgi:hypothetical protein
MLAVDKVDFIVGRGEKGAAGENIRVAGKTSRALKDDENDLVGGETLRESGDFEVVC